MRRPMGNRGRFGKYGEKKRIDRLRQSRIGKTRIGSDGTGPVVIPPRPKKLKAKKIRVSIKPAEASDAGFIEVLGREAFEQYGPYDEMLPYWFRSGIGITFLAWIGKRPAGYVMLARPQGGDLGVRVAELLAIAVEAGARRRGIGDLLTREIIRKAEKLLVNTLILHTAVDNLPAQALFKKHGFVPAGIKKEFYPERQSALLMQKEISLRVNGYSTSEHEEI